MGEAESTDKKRSILIVDDEASNIMTLTRMLSEDYNVYASKNGKDAIEAAKKYLPDMILLDIIMPEMDGYEVISNLRKHEETKHILVIFITGLESVEAEKIGLSVGAVDYISKPFEPTIVKLRVRNQFKMLEQIEVNKQLSLTDHLTGTANKRSFDHRLSLELNRSNREKMPFSILMIDIDDFKQYNEMYGRLQGDEVLKAAAGVIAQVLKRSIDFAARYGGDEFAVLLSNTDLPGACHVAEKLRSAINDVSINHTDGKETKITASIGVNTYRPEAYASLADFIDGVHKALDEAKNSGKNKVCNL